MKKFLSLLLALLCLTPVLTACASDASTTGVTDTTGSAPATDTTPATTEPEETQLMANIPEGTNFKGYVFNIANGFHNATKYTTNAIAPEEVTGDTLNDAIYKRTMLVEDKLNLDIVDANITQAQMKTMLQAGSADFDLMTVDLSGVRSFINIGVVLDFNELPNIDLSMPLVGSERTGKAIG